MNSFTSIYLFTLLDRFVTSKFLANFETLRDHTNDSFQPYASVNNNFNHRSPNTTIQESIMALLEGCDKDSMTPKTCSRL